MKKHLIEINKIQATVVLENLEKHVEDCKKLENDFDVSNKDRQELRKERLEVEMLIQQILALEWE